jgi:hypothetical protein
MTHEMLTPEVRAPRASRSAAAGKADIARMALFLASDD